MSAKGRGKCIERHLPGLSEQMSFDAFDERSEPGKRSFTGLCPSDDLLNSFDERSEPGKRSFTGLCPCRK